MVVMTLALPFFFPRLAPRALFVALMGSFGLIY
jgi:hypothetical protein